MMTVVRARPPLFDGIDAAFGIAGKPVIFAWGDRIFNPEGVRISPELMAHEMVHGKRQGAGIEAWWRRYMTEPEFRLAEEIPAHQVEYRAFCENHTNGPGRNARRLALHHVAARLSSPLYGRLVSYEAARRLIKAAA